MHKLYNDENPDKKVSFSFYYTMFKKEKLKSHQPKKDMCALCECFLSGTNTVKEELREKYNAHIQEKEKVREIKLKLKECSSGNDDLLVGCFDLEQVLYLPMSNLSEIFYKRRLACYNFTVYELNSREGHCFFWHEGIAGLGSNKIASHLHNFLQVADKKNKERCSSFL